MGVTRAQVAAFPWQLLERHQEAEGRLQGHQAQMQAMLEDKKTLTQAKEKKRQELKVIQVHLCLSSHTPSTLTTELPPFCPPIIV